MAISSRTSSSHCSSACSRSNPATPRRAASPRGSRLIRSFIAVALLALAGGALAAGRPPPAKVCSAYFEADEVFVGRVTSVDRLGMTIRYHMQVERTVKGTPAETRIVDSENTADRWTAEPGERRVVFARNGQVGNWSDPVDRPSQVFNTLSGIETIG